jgi:CRP/FNR family transcriptional regulator, anaerobic regulatory protein
MSLSDTFRLNQAQLCQLYPPLESLTSAEFSVLLNPAATISIPAGTTVFLENQPCQGFPLVVSGKIKVFKSAPNGRELLLYRVSPSGSCIISSSCLLAHTDYNARGIAETDVTLLLIPPSLFSQILLAHTAFRDFVFHLFAERISHLMQLVEEVAFTRLDQRLAKWLLARNESSIHATHQQIADELGSVREIVSRLLRGFLEQGLITLGRENIQIIDSNGLEKILAL